MIRQKNFSLVAALLSATLAGMPVVSAQEAPKAGAPGAGQPAPAGQPAADAPKDQPQNGGIERDNNNAEFLATTRFIEAYTTGDWDKAEKAYRELTENWPIYRQDPQYVYKYAFVLFKLATPAKKNESADQLEALLQKDDTHIMALYLLAQIKAGLGAEKKQAQADAKEHLLNAARNGFFTLREIMNAKAAEFEYLRNDPKFILAAMRAQQDFNVLNSIKGSRNPFELPIQYVIKDKDPTAEQGLTDKRKKELESRVDALFVEIDKLAREQRVEELIPKFTEFYQIMQDYGKGGRDEVAKKLEQWKKRLDEWKEIRLAIELQIYITEGNDYLKKMVKSKQAERFEEVFEGFANMKNLVEKMRKAEREEFHRNAEAFLVRAKALNDEALKLKKIKEFHLVVTGIVLDPRPEGKNKAIIVFDDPDKRGRIYEENEDLRSKDDKRVEGLKIMKISENTIRFRYEDTEFVRVLENKQ